ncbi:MAG TPA: excinuclease ABC subunit UvrB [Candidatus Paceibacterota bacterium]|nr:excinuclease ABC subunit UvrB [Candidatus Paceibacterota bacterium]HRR45626.1 excinuclease ABC subunit UvrB [Candidatus Paceibacterota bacterium]
MGIFKLNSQFQVAGDQQQAIEKLVEGLKKGYRFQTLLGITGSGKTFTMANVISHFNKPVLVIAPNKTLAAQLYREYKNFFPENSVNYFVSYYDYYQPEAYLPITDTYIGKEALINEEIDRLRHQSTSALLSRRDVIIVASVSCIYNLGVPLNYLQSALYLEKGKLITRGDFLRQLVKIQFERTNGELKRGTFRVRGDNFEILPASGEAIYFIKIKDQEITEIALLEPTSKKILEELKEIVIFPPKHFVSFAPQREQAIKEIEKELKERVDFFRKQGKELEAERLLRRTTYDLEMLRTIGYCHGIENYSRYLTGKLAGEPPDTLLSYFPKDFLTIIDESHITLPQIRGMSEGDRSRKSILIEYGWRLPSALDNRPLTFDEFLERVNQVIFTSATPSQEEKQMSSQIVEQLIRPTGIVDPEIEVRPVFDEKIKQTQVEDLIKELEKIVKRNERALVNVLTKKMAEDLTDYLLKKGFKVNYMHSETKTIERTKILKSFREGEINVLVGVNLLREGLDLPEVTLVAILDADREGFLRSETSLIQTMGRAARNVLGKVILYANEITPSMKKAIEEVERRRKIQLAYNKQHHITPQTIQKKIENLIDFD